MRKPFKQGRHLVPALHAAQRLCAVAGVLAEPFGPIVRRGSFGTDACKTRVHQRLLNGSALGVLVPSRFVLLPKLPGIQFLGVLLSGFRSVVMDCREEKMENIVLFARLNL